MIILNNMYTGRYITEQGNLGHEAINLFRSDDKDGQKGKFYIWLNSMGVCTQKGVNGSTVLMVRTINSKRYKVLAKAVNCQLCPGADVSRKKGNEGVDDKEKRQAAQAKMGVTYNGRSPVTEDGIFGEADMFATFSTDQVYEPVRDIYITNDENEKENTQEDIYYGNFRISEAMRTYLKDDNDLKKLLDAPVWREISQQIPENIAKPEFNFFKLIRKDKDELSFSNALAYFVEKAGIRRFLQDGLQLEGDFLEDDYQLLREKNNIDISFFGERNVVIIENKIDATITVDQRKNIDSQIKRALELYFEKKESDGAEEKAQLQKLAENDKKLPSQLSKYYFYAAAYLLKKGVPFAQLQDHIKCFLLVPEYAKKQFSTNAEGFYDSKYKFSEKYRLITYLDVYNFFHSSQVEDRYLEDFLSAMVPLKKEFNNDLEEEMKIRFFKGIGKL